MTSEAPTPLPMVISDDASPDNLGSVQYEGGSLLRAREIYTADVCGWAQTLCAVHDDAADVICVYKMLSDMQSSFDNAQRCYQAMCRSLAVAPHRAVLRTCADHDGFRASLRSRNDRSTSPSSRAQRRLTLGSSDSREDDAPRAVAASPPPPPMVYEPSTAWRVDLAHAYIGLRGVIALLAALPQLTQVHYINLSYCRLDSTQVVLLCRACRPAALPLLDTLVLSHNPFGSLAGEALVELCVAHPNIVNVHVDGVELIAPVHRRLMDRLALNRQRRGLLADDAKASPRNSLDAIAVASTSLAEHAVPASSNADGTSQGDDASPVST
jgi:hypothetical protein